MSLFSFKAEFEDNKSVELVPDYVRPFGPLEILELEENESTPLNLEMRGNSALLNGKPEPGHATVKAKVIFNKPTTIFALVPNGWVPMPFAMPSRFLVDRNVVITLRKIREGKVAANAESLTWWSDFFAQGSPLFNPLPFAFEANFQRKPTMDEFVAGYEEGAAELLHALPKCHVIHLSAEAYRAAYAQLEAFDSRPAQEIAFLQEVCPTLVNRPNRLNGWKLAKEVLCAADKHQVNRASIVCLAALSCLFEHDHGKPPAIGRRILKPKNTYSEEMAFNALSDIRHIELAAAGQALFKQEAFSMCTCDRGLALIWSALSLNGEFNAPNDFELTFNLTSDLFQRLHEADILRLRALVCQ
ncbi:hypothetical protein [Rhodoferax sp.]|uniref:hypothetical protein n=1 Tax=Rhodoferax sp. TaxID=50421 RepID=UPI002851A9B7|nr:hypothetical protein [Rhodoferax sp.]MDR3371501.1 hypothetical protein [Rhodoferax sp.]